MERVTEEWLKHLDSQIKAKNIRVRDHATLPLKIYNYTGSCQAGEHWNEITLKCRGLVLDASGRIVVNAPPKFFNYYEAMASPVSADSLILEKLDGYYISVTKDPEYGLIITSRGSFDSQYVAAAKKFVTPAIIENLVPGLSYFCELCQDFEGAESIIVARHPDPMLVCWAIRSQGGTEFSPRKLSPFPFARTITQGEVAKYMQEPVEGVVLFDPVTGNRVKSKTEFYLTQHKIILGFSKLKIWRMLKDNISLETLPDELYPQAKEWAQELSDSYTRFSLEVQDAFKETLSLTDKELGLLDRYHDLKPFIFLARKGKQPEYRLAVWKKIRPTC